MKKNGLIARTHRLQVLAGLVITHAVPASPVGPRKAGDGALVRPTTLSLSNIVLELAS